MKSIKEKAEEFHEVIRVINEHESIVNTQGSKMFVEGANYVLDVVEDFMKHNLVCSSNLKKLIEQLKK
jgi:hypothetical protein